MKLMVREGYRLVRRDWRSRELRILALALIVAVATVTAITLFSAKLQQMFYQSSSQFLAADRQLTSPNPVDPLWLLEAQRRGLRIARTLEFPSMLFAGDDMQLVSVKAVTQEYPLKGSLEISGPGGEGARQVDQGPAPGTIWIAPRLLSLLQLQVGEMAAVGDQDLRVAGIIQREPDTSFNFMSLSPRVMMSWEDLEATGVIQPGSRLRYRYLFAGEPEALAGFEAWLTPQLEPTMGWLDVRSGRPAVANALDKAESYLLLGGSLAVILAGLAIAMSARQYSQRQYDTVALLKTLGVKGGAINRFYGLGFLALGLICTCIGMVLGWIGHFFALWALQDLLPQVSTQAPPSSFAIGGMTALVSLLAFAMPPLLMLQRVAPVRVLRRDLQGEAGSTAWLYGVGILAMVGLLFFYSGDLKLTGLVVGGLAAVVLVFVALSGLLLRTSRLVGTRAGSYWKLGLASVVRRRWQSILQIVVFAIALMLLVVIYLMRTSLVSEWQAQLPADAPNHFLINIAPAEMAEVKSYLVSHEIDSAGLYAMVRGRLSHINGQPARQAVSKEEEVNALNRELNLTWMDQLPADNHIVAGQWWGPEVRNQPWVSVEAQLADRLGLKPGDRLTFTIGDRLVEAEVKSIRSVQWDSMKPNFYMVFTPGFLDGFPATYITSIYLAPEQKSLLNELGRKFPTVTVLELDQLIERVRTVMEQVSKAIELVLALILVAALLVVASLVNTTMGERRRESALLRAMGAGRRLVAGSLFVEFAVLGALAGVVAVFGAELIVLGMQQRVFQIEMQPHPLAWLLTPVVGALVIGSLGYLQSLKTIRVAPIEALRQAE